ncbi:MAG: alpha-amylase family glycosyl hydrolase, partial [Desulforhopalus sp.]|nr:alpha-amylase family glycosyl hydrolase [Desulforhopalus sp.]
MPFGTEILPDGVLFRLWAPGARRVDLILEKPDQPACRQKMNAEHGGWYRSFSREARPGSAYRFAIDADLLVPDPASRCQAEDVHGPSLVIDPRAFSWQDGSWRGRPWEEAVIYELHPGAFSPQGGFAGVAERLDYLVELGITALELMPVADFPGKRNWGYDGTLLFAPDRSYGRPEELKTLVQAAHARNLMVFLDVVYNHFGPEGNYLHVYAREEFFTDKRRTPWGAALNFDGEGSALVRRFFVDNVLYWLEEYHFDGLRFDAVHAIHDDSHPDILEEIADTVRNGPGRRRHIHLILENDQNQVGYLRRSA